MVHRVYATELIRAIVEETRLNANPNSNLSLYNLINDTKKALQHPLSEAINPVAISTLKDDLARYQQSYTAQHYCRELSVYQSMREAQEILERKCVFDLNEVAYLIRDLGQGYNARNSPAAHAYRQKLDQLWVLVQKGKLHAQKVRPINVPEIKEIATVLARYRDCSSEISGIHKVLQRDIQQQHIDELLSS